MIKKLRKKTSSSTKGALIKGMSRLLPSEILLNPIFEKKLKELMKDFGGIYGLYKQDKLYYVGLTKDLHGRIVKGHLKDRHAHRWDGFKIFRIKRIRYLKDLETLVQHLTETKGNKQKGHVPRDASLNHILREVLKQHEVAIKGIKKALN